MTVRNPKIGVTIEATTEGAVKNTKKFTDGMDDSRKATEKNNEALKKSKLAYQVQQARVKNAADRVKAFAAAEQRATAATNKHRAAIEKISGGYRNLFSNVGKVAGGIRNVGSVIGGAVSTITSAAEATAELAQESLAAQNVFANLPFSLNAARKSTKGLAADMDLARNAILANQAGIATTGEAYGELVGIAQTLALKMGRDVNETVQRVTEGLAKQEREVLDELVVLPKMNELLDIQAKKLGKTAEQLSGQERQLAFTEGAMQALRAATKGVNVDMDGAAGAIARTVVELKNAKTEILGATEQARPLREGLLGLEEAQLRVALSAGKSRVEGFEAQEILENQGVAVDNLRGKNLLLAQSVDKVLKFEAKRFANRADDQALTKEDLAQIEKLISAGFEFTDLQNQLFTVEARRLGVSREQIAVQEQEAAVREEETNAIREQIVVVQDQLALSKARGDPQAEINNLVAFELRLKAEILEAEGDLEGAVKARRKAELAGIAAEGAGRRRGGRRGPSRADRDRDAFLAAQKQQLNQFQRVNTLMVSIAAKRAEDIRQIEAQNNPFSPENVELQLANVIDLNARRAQIELAQRQRAIEEQRAAGVEPIMLAQMEADAKIAAVQATAQARDAELQRQIELAILQDRLSDADQLRSEKEIAAAESLDEVEAETHALAMARIAQRDKIERASFEKRQELIQRSSGLWIGAAEAVARSVVLQGKSLKKAVASVAKAKALEHGILAASEGIKALIAFASFDFVRGAAHIANAANSAIFAAGMGALAAAAGAGGGGGVAVPGALGAASFGPGVGAPAGGASTGGPREGGDIGGEVPLSRSRDLDATGQAQTPTPGQGTTITVTNNITTLGEPNEETILALDQASRRTTNKLGRIRAGGM